MKKTILMLLIAGLFSISHSKASKVFVSKSLGFNVNDATPFLQQAFNSSYDTIVVDYVGKDWITTPLFLKSNKFIIFEPGVVIMAKTGAFHGNNDCLFTITNASNISIIGYGATFRMRKTDYQNSNLYSVSEYRHALKIQALVNQPVENITVKGLHFELSGGDGIVISGISGYPDHNPVQPKNILIQDVVCDKNHRDAISVTGGENVKIVNAVMKETSGTPPQAGIDWEPDWERLINVSMTNCLMYNNKVTGLKMYLYRPAWRGPTDIDVTFNNCHIDSDNGIQGIALAVSNIEDTAGSPGSIIFNDCSFRNKTSYNTLYIADKSAYKARLTFNRCFMEQINSSGMVIELATENAATKDLMTFGGIDFNDCIINDMYNRNFISFSEYVSTGKGIRDIQGSVMVNNPYGAKSNFGALSQNINLLITENKTKPPLLNIASPLLLQKYLAGDSVLINATSSDPDAGTSDGAGISKVLFEVRYADSLIYSGVDSIAPFSVRIFTAGWQPGIYLIKAIAVSKDFDSRNICVRAFEIIPKPVIPTTIIDDTVPTIPTGLSSSAITENSFILSWIASSDNRMVKGYEVFKDGLSSGTTADTFLNIEGLTCNSAYSMTVKAIDTMLNVSGTSTALQVVTSACTDLQAPSVPANLSSSALNSNSFLLSWDASSDNVGVKGYEVFKNGLSVGTTDSTSFKLTGLTCNTSYELTVKAYDASKNQSDPSLTLNVTTTACYYEAEKAKLNGGVIAQDHAGYSGTGFWADVNAPGDYAQFTVISAVGGSTVVTCRYSAGYGNQTMSLYVNGSKIKQLGFSTTTNWETWANKIDTVMLNAGSNTIKYQYDPDDNGTINIDYIDITPLNSTEVSSLEENELLIYPNPSNSILTIANVPTNASISVIAIDGRIVKTLNAKNEAVDIDVKGWIQGLYLIRIATDKKVMLKSIIIK